MIVQSLWIGELSPMEKLSMRSFLAQGHPYHLYTFGDVEDVPAGVEIHDAAEILPWDPEKFLEWPALFSDFFRFKLLAERDGWWADTDVVALKKFDFSNPFVFASEVSRDGKIVPASCVLKIPRKVASWCFEKCQSIDIGQQDWKNGGATGPAIIREAIDYFALGDCVRQPEEFNFVAWWETWRFIETRPGLSVESPTNAVAAHLWGGMWGPKGYNLDKSSATGYYGDLQQRYSALES